MDAATVAAVASATATVLLVGLTAFYVVFTQRLVKETRAARLPTVYVDLEFAGVEAKFVVGNSGPAPAFGIRFGVIDAIPWREQRKGDGLEALPAVRDGISYLAPGRVLKYHVGLIDWDRVNGPYSGSAKINLGYRDQFGEVHDLLVQIDLKQYQRILAESFSNPAYSIAAAIRDTESSRQSERWMDRSFPTIVKRECPTCGERISLRAKKCRYCGEPVEPMLTNAAAPTGSDAPPSTT